MFQKPFLISVIGIVVVGAAALAYLNRFAEREDSVASNNRQPEQLAVGQVRTGNWRDTLAQARVAAKLLRSATTDATTDASTPAHELHDAVEFLLRYRFDGEIPSLFHRQRYQSVKMQEPGWRGGTIRSACFDLSNDLMCIVSEQNAAELWRISTVKRLCRFREDLGLETQCFTFVSSDLGLLVDVNGVVHRLNLTKNSIEGTIDFEDRIYHLTVDEPSQKLTAITLDGRILCGDIGSFQRTQPLAIDDRRLFLNTFGVSQGVTRVAFVSDSNRLSVIDPQASKVSSADIDGETIFRICVSDESVLLHNRKQLEFFDVTSEKLIPAGAVRPASYETAAIANFYSPAQRQWLVFEANGVIHRYDDDFPWKAQYESLGNRLRYTNVFASPDRTRFAFASSGIIHLKDYAGEWPDGETELLRLLFGLLEGGDFERLRNLVDLLLTVETPINPSSLDREEWLATRLVKWNNRHSTSEDSHAALKAWVAHCGDWEFARQLQIYMLIDEGWEARGSGYAFTVTDEGWEVFHRKLEAANELLKPSLEVSQPSPLAFRNYITIAKGIGLDASEQIERCVELYPRSQMIHTRILEMLLPRWGGELGDMQQHASRVADLVGGAEGDLLYASLVSSIDGYEPDSPEFFEQHGFDYERMLRAGQAIDDLELYRPVEAHTLAYLAFKRKDESAIPLLQQLTKHPRDEPYESSVWFRRQYPEYCKWAQIAPSF